MHRRGFLERLVGVVAGLLGIGRAVKVNTLPRKTIWRTIILHPKRYPPGSMLVVKSRAWQFLPPEGITLSPAPTDVRGAGIDWNKVREAEEAFARGEFVRLNPDVRPQ